VSNDIPDYNVGDLIRAMLGNPLDAIAKADIVPDQSVPAQQARAEASCEQIAEQVRPPTQEEQAEIEALAESAAQLQDEIKALMGDRSKKMRALKDQLKDRFLRHGLKEVTIAGRPPIELTESKNRKPTRKAIIEVMQKTMIAQLGDEKEGKKQGKMKALNLWNAIEQTTSNSISIPDPSPPEMESPY